MTTNTTEADLRFGALPVVEFPAIRLFAQRASAAVDGYTLSDTDAPLLGRPCRQLDGIPLAIEFAAARVDRFGVRGLADLSDRLRLLTRGRRTDLARHRTLKATLDWSFKLLSMQEQIVLSRLAVFVEAFTLDAAQAVASDDRISRGAVAECMMNLVSKSLISSFTGDSVIRYRQLETLDSSGTVVGSYRPHSALPQDAHSWPGSSFSRRTQALQPGHATAHLAES